MEAADKIDQVTGLPPKGGSLPLKLDSPIEGSSSLAIIVTPSGIEPSEVTSLPLPAKAGSPTEVSLWVENQGAGMRHKEELAMGETLEPPYIIVKLRGDDDERVYRNATVTESDGRIYVTRGDRTIATFDEGALEYWDHEN